MAIVEQYPVVGIDLSRWRPVEDYERVSEQIYFMMTKVSDGWKVNDSHEDPTFQDNWFWFKHWGRARQGFHFVRFYHDARKAKKQAEEFCDILMGTGDIGEIYPCLDIEKIGFVEDVTKFEAQNFIWKMIFRISELLGIPGDDIAVYTNASTWNERVAPYPGATDIPRHRPLTTASWILNPPPRVPWDWYQRYGEGCWTFWQYTSRLKVDGIAEGRLVDAQVFNGDLAAFNAQFNMNLQPLGQEPPIEPPPPPTDPLRIEIVGLDDNETLRIREGVWGTTRAKTWNGAEFAVVGTSIEDAEGRQWYRIGPEICVASWYTKVLI